MWSNSERWGTTYAVGNNMQSLIDDKIACWWDKFGAYENIQEKNGEINISKHFKTSKIVKFDFQQWLLTEK